MEVKNKAKAGAVVIISILGLNRILRTLPFSNWILDVHCSAHAGWIIRYSTDARTQRGEDAGTLQTEEVDARYVAITHISSDIGTKMINLGCESTSSCRCHG